MISAFYTTPPQSRSAPALTNYLPNARPPSPHEEAFYLTRDKGMIAITSPKLRRRKKHLFPHLRLLRNTNHDLRREKKRYIPIENATLS